ncbi:MAG: 4-hydroxythreonine-4-phosphate dehydrogenase PdxA [Muribaculaceae bacterium]|nr:4-hydroxythreonine-4-phosphate dehydrogenase PdxA [Muribaculaceae bacterium]
MDKLRVGLTQGDTNGVGLEIILKAVIPEGVTDLCTPVIFANRKLVQSTLQAITDENVRLQHIPAASDVVDGRINVMNIGEAPIEPTYGTGTPESGRGAFASLEAAVKALADGDIDVLVTAPINKQAIQSETFHFPGHTEYLQDRLGEEGERALMVLFNDDMRIALLTTHLPISKVSDEVRADRIVETVRLFDRALRRDFGCDRPRIAVLSLNPHCGDGGLLGDEEQREIIPAISTLRDENLLVFGPYAADGFFAQGLWRQFDGVMAMYHDQGLAPFKALATHEGVNFTSGLGYVRTSPDHGTAYDIAGQMTADPTSMREAIYRAIDIFRNREHYDEAAANPLKSAHIKS